MICRFLFLAGFLFPLLLPAQCRFEVSIPDSLSADSFYVMDGFVISGVKGSQANTIATDIPLYRGNSVMPSESFLGDKLSRVCLFRKKQLRRVVVSATSGRHILLRFMYEEVADSLLKK